MGLRLGCKPISNIFRYCSSKLEKQLPAEFKDRFDYIVVGGGSAGCVVASRLSENAAIRVLLLESGKDYAGTKMAALIDGSLWRSFYQPDFYWAGAGWGTADESGHRSLIHTHLAHLLGGGAAVNGMQAQRGAPDDYNAWSQLGLRGWSYEDCLPYFKKLEIDADFPDSDQHGSSGPLQISRFPLEKWGPFALAVRDKWMREGLPWLDDVNGQAGDGVGAMPMNVAKEKRQSTVANYLGPEVRARANLSIRCSTQVSRILFEAQRAVGVELQNGDTIGSGEVVLCAGTINSPALLLRSGVGPGEVLQNKGIRPIIVRRGVGRNLRNHTGINLAMHLKKAGRQPLTLPFSNVLTNRYSSSVAGCEDSDMSAALYERIPGAPLLRDPLSRHIGSLSVVIYKSYSSGQVLLNDLDPMRTPVLDIDLLSDWRDLERLRQGLAYAWRTLSDPGVAPYVNEIFLPDTSSASPHLFNTPAASLVSHIGGAVLSGWAGMRRALLTGTGASLLDLSCETISDKLVRDATVGLGHWVGTCRLGSPQDEDAVVDTECRLIGAEGVRVVDASIFPAAMRAGTNLPTIMAAEKVVAEIARAP